MLGAGHDLPIAWRAGFPLRSPRRSRQFRAGEPAWARQLAVYFGGASSRQSRRPKLRAAPSVTAGVRWTSDSGNDDINIVANGIAGGHCGHDNLRWCGLTCHHRFNDRWHIRFESYNLAIIGASDMIIHF